MAKETVSEEAIKKATQDLRKEDLDKRAKAFNVKLLSLLKEFDLALGAHPFMIQDPRTRAFQISAQPQIVDDKKWDEDEKDAVPESTASNSADFESPKGELSEG